MSPILSWPPVPGMEPMGPEGEENSPPRPTDRFLSMIVPPASKRPEPRSTEAVSETTNENERENSNMSIVQIDPPQPPERRGPGRPAGSRGNGKTAKEKIARIENAQLVRAAEVRAMAAEAKLKIIQQVEERRAKQGDRVFDTYEAQETKRSPQFQIDQKGTLYLLVGLAVVMFLTTAVLTADGTIGSAGAARFISPVLGFVLFGAFEVGILVFLLLYYIRGSRINIITGKRVKSIQWFIAAVAVSALTVALSAYHVMDLYEYDWSSIDLYVGIGIRVAVSVLFVLISKGIAGVLFAQAIDLNQIARVGAAQADEGQGR